MSDIAIRVEGIGKKYQIGALKRRHDTLRDQLAHGLGSLFRTASSDDQRQRDQTFWALRNVSFDVKHGEVLGLIGRNGAGKSTLLKVLSRITVPTEGRAEIYGRMRSLLEVGTGFSVELTGRENIYLNAALFGFTTREIRAVESAIVEFSELQRFIDLPTKNYSSGMQLRLGMSIALEVKPDIFLVDEVLAVGDEHFRIKCLQRLAEERRAGRTFLVASHNLQFIEETCDRAALFIQGQVVFVGRGPNAVRRYRRRLAKMAGIPVPEFPQVGAAVSSPPLQTGVP